MSLPGRARSSRSTRPARRRRRTAPSPSHSSSASPSCSDSSSPSHATFSTASSPDRSDVGEPRELERLAELEPPRAGGGFRPRPRLREIDAHAVTLLGQSGFATCVPKARSRVVRRDDLAVVCRDDATFRAAGYRSAVHDRLARIRPHATELLVVAFAAATIIELFVVHGIRHPVADSFLALVWTLPYAARDRLPVPPPFVAAAGLAGFGIVEAHGTEHTTLPFIAALLTAATAGTLPDRRQRIMGWTAIIGAAAIVDYRSSNTPADFFWTTLILSLAWFFGVALASRTAQTRELRERVAVADRERSLAVERAAADERARIARELHDVVAHSVSVMVVQASGRAAAAARRPGARTRGAPLGRARSVARRSTEMRRMLGVMRTRRGEAADLAPQPGLEHSTRLIAQVEEAGLPVTLRVEGERPDLPVGIDLSAYRIVQEGLTNALKHAKGAHADVLVRYGGGGRRGRGHATTARVRTERAARDGHGLVGMRERVALYGGTLDAGPRRRRRVRAARAAPGGGARVIRILLVDDQALVRAGFRMILDAEAEIEVVGEAADGREAIDQVRVAAPRRRPDGHPHARARRARGDAPDPRRRRRGRRRRRRS